MNFWQFANQSPVLTFFGLLFICLTIESGFKAWAIRKASK